jgi:hypothetical protein
MPSVLSRRELIAEIDAEHARLLGLIERVPSQAWATSRINSAAGSLNSWVDAFRPIVASCRRLS